VGSGHYTVKVAIHEVVPGGVDYRRADNRFPLGADSVQLAHTLPSHDTSSLDTEVWARFTLTSAVPEPGTWAMMLLGFGAVGWVMRRKKQIITSLA